MENESSNKSVIFGVVGGLVGLVVFVIILAACGVFHQHEFGEWKTVKAVTCTEDGMKEHVCECGEKETQVIPATGHNWKDATCESPKKCANCGKTEGEALGHTTDSGTCSRCGKNLGKWKTVTYSDNSKGVELKEYVQGVFSNTATTNSKLLVDIRYQKSTKQFYFIFYEYGSHQAKNPFSHSVDYTINIDGANGGYFHSAGADCFGQPAYSEFFCPWDNTNGGYNLREWLISALDSPGHTYTVFLQSEDQPLDKYKFTIESSNFGELYRNL